MNKVVIAKKRQKARLTDLTTKDLHLLALASSVPDESFVSFSSSFFRLAELGLITDEAQITYSGRMYLYELNRNEKIKIQ
jgi:hypothetical protein